MPKVPAKKIQLTPEQSAAYAKLRDGIRAVVELDAPDAETLQAWLRSRFSGPIGEPAILREVAEEVGGGVGIHFLDDFGGAFGVERFDD
jgi:hypothetical protein